MAMMTAAEYDAFRERRMSCIGGSDAAAAMGLSPWATPLKLWGIKTGQIEDDDLSGREEIEWGHRHEDAIAEAYHDKTGLRVERRNQMQVHPSFRHMGCHVDRQAFRQDLGKGVLQIKTSDKSNREKWTDPHQFAEEYRHYSIQLQHEMFVTGSKWGEFVVLVGGNRFLFGDDYEHLRVTPHEPFVELMLKEELEFWKCVEQMRKPKLCPSRSNVDKVALGKLYPVSEAEPMPVLLDDKTQLAWSYLDPMRRDRKETGTKIEALENEIKARLGNSTVGMFRDGSKYTLTCVETRKPLPKKAILELHKELEAKFGPATRTHFPTPESLWEWLSKSSSWKNAPRFHPAPKAKNV